jgi:Flp pilus assembly protein TadG
LLRDRRGGAIIEFAFIAPALFALVLGTLDFGRMFYIRQGMENAVEQGAHYYVLNPSATQATVTGQISAAMVGGMGSQLNVAYADTTTCNSQAALTCTKITVTYPFSFIVGYLGLAGKTLTATASAMRWN